MSFVSIRMLLLQMTLIPNPIPGQSSLINECLISLDCRYNHDEYAVDAYMLTLGTIVKKKAN